MKHSSLLLFATILPICANAADGTSFTAPEAGTWYRLVTRYTGSDSRSGSCIQYFPDTKDYDLYMSAQLQSTDADYDCQYWRFEEDPDNPGYYAVISRAYPDGYLSTIPQYNGQAATASQLGKDCRWKYVTDPADSPTDKYGFVFLTNDGMGGVDSSTGYSYSAISTKYVMDLVDDNLKENIYMNAGGARVDYAVNLWSQDYDEQANEWNFNLQPENEVETSISDIFSDPAASAEIYYDLSGHPHQTPVRGINIVGRQKIFIP